MSHDTLLMDFLAYSLVLWGIDGTVQPGTGSMAAEIRRSDGAWIAIERAPADSPFRWLVRWRKAGEPPGGVRELRPRACGSLTGLLAAMREALNVERGSAVRIVPAPLDA